MPVPIMNEIIVFQFHSFISFPTNQVEANTKPKKKDHTKMGCAASSHVMSLASEKTLMPIPSRMENKKLPLIYFQKAPHLPVKRSFRLSLLMLFMELINSS